MRPEQITKHIGALYSEDGGGHGYLVDAELMISYQVLEDDGVTIGVLIDELLEATAIVGREIEQGRASLREFIANQEGDRPPVIGTKEAKREATRIRRYEFDRARSRLILQMLNSGTEYACAYPECDADEGLTVDHILPLSQGGSDDLENLQFLCRSHNSQKGAAVADFKKRRA